MTAITTRGLRKEYDRKLAVQDLTLTVKRGEVFGFLGPNGAGKTTSVKMLLGLVKPTSGDASVLGTNISAPGALNARSAVKARAKIGFLPEHFRFQDWLTGREFLRYHGRFYGMSGAALTARIEQLLDRVQLTDAAERQLKTYSKGMLQRIGLAQALLNRPELVFLDEPTSGLDPLGRLLVRDIMAELRREGTAVFLNSHLLGEVEVTCDRVAFVSRGVVLREMSLRNEGHALEVDLRVGNAPADLPAQLAQFGSHIRQVGGSIKLVVDDESRLPELTRWLVAQNVAVYHLAAAHQSLESLFLEVMGEQEKPG